MRLRAVHRERRARGACRRPRRVVADRDGAEAGDRDADELRDRDPRADRQPRTSLTYCAAQLDEGI